MPFVCCGRWCCKYAPYLHFLQHRKKGVGSAGMLVLLNFTAILARRLAGLWKQNSIREPILMLGLVANMNYLLGMSFEQTTSIEAHW